MLVGVSGDVLAVQAVFFGDCRGGSGGFGEYFRGRFGEECFLGGRGVSRIPQNPRFAKANRGFLALHRPSWGGGRPRLLQRNRRPHRDRACVEGGGQLLVVVIDAEVAVCADHDPGD